MTLRAKVREDGSIAGYYLGNYSGGDWFDLFLHRLANGEFFWVLEGNGFRRTLFLKPACSAPGEFSDDDLDELGLYALNLWRSDELEERDAQMRKLIKEISGEEMPPVVPKASDPNWFPKLEPYPSNAL